MSDGLEDVVAAHTVLSEVDGAAGRLVMRGHSLDELAGRTSFDCAVAQPARAKARVAISSGLVIIFPFFRVIASGAKQSPASVRTSRWLEIASSLRSSQ